MTGSPKTILAARGLLPKKSFGQNFMMDQRINAIFAQAAQAFGQGLPVVEIGAGTGSLTKHLLAMSPLVHAIERDRDLAPLVREQFNAEIAQGHLVVHEADGAHFNLASVLSVDKPGVLVGNLPYHLTSTIMLLAMHHRHLIRGAVFLVQKEVADRLAAKPCTKDYGLLTVVLNLAFAIRKVHQVDKSAFWPVPKIDSTIIALTPRDNGLSLDDVDGFVSFVRSIFQKRRKKLSTILAGNISKDELVALGISPDARPETLSPEQFVRMFAREQARKQ